MSATSAIEWTDATWNPVTGCTKVSPGCAHCYAETFAERFRGTPGHPFEQGFDLKLWPERLDLPLRWRKPRMVFVNSMSDLFHEDVPDEFIARVFAVMALAHQHTFQVLTKRPERMRDLLKSWRFCKATMNAIFDIAREHQTPNAMIPAEVVEESFASLTNVWLGVSIENRRFVGRADVLRETPAAVRFISAEPLLGPLVKWEEPEPGRYPAYDWSGTVSLHDIDWLIVGGESGPRHRPIRAEWVRELRDAAHEMGTAFFFKQWGGARPKSNGRELDGKTYNEMPDTTEATAS